MQIILAEAKIADNTLEEGRAAIESMIEATRAEEGCLSYSYAQDVLEPGKLLIVEQYADDAAIGAHMKSPHMAEFQKVAATLGIRLTKLMKYESDEGTALL